MLYQTKYEQNFDSLYLGVPIAERIGLNGGSLFLRGLCTLADTESSPGFEPTGLSLL